MSDSMPRPAPDQGGCPPGYRPIPAYQGMPAGARPCGPVGPAVPQGGWREARPGTGPGYPPTGSRAVEALMSLPGAAGEAVFGRGGDRGITDADKVGGFMGEYSEWLRGMAGR